ncbi:MAG: hypothetical protein K6G69_03890 [Lachnospiraceae bacterium]|nr:hypothetical protein [Lachnospiraceae bacterium]
MAIFNPKPLKEQYVMEDAAADIKRAARMEKYRVSDRAVYIPAGLMWEYLPMSCIHEVRRAKRSVSAENSCIPFDQDLPAITLLYGEEEKYYLELNSEKTTEKFLSLLTQAIG